MPIQRIQKIASVICLTLAGTISILIYFSISNEIPSPHEINKRVTDADSSLVLESTDHGSSDPAVADHLLRKPIEQQENLVPQEVKMEFNDPISTNNIANEPSEVLDFNDSEIAAEINADEFPYAAETLPTPAREYIRLEALKLSVNQRIDDLLDTPLDESAIEQLKRDIEELHQKAVLLPSEADRLKNYVLYRQESS